MAKLYGWKPMGTQPPSVYDFHKLGAEWDGTYLTNDGQMIKARDALSLAAALEKALEDIPDAQAKMDWNSKFWIQEDFPEWLSPEEREMIEDSLENELLDIMGMHPSEYFAGNEKYHLKQFIRFCRLGSFIIL